MPTAVEIFLPPTTKASVIIAEKTTEHTTTTTTEKTTMHTTITATPKHLSKPQSTSSKFPFEHDSHSQEHRLALEIALPISLIVLALLLSLLWQRQRRRNKERFGNDNASSERTWWSRKESKHWWQRISPMKGRFAMGDKTGAPEKTVELKSCEPAGNDLRSDQQQQSEDVAEMAGGDKTSTRLEMPAPASPQSSTGGVSIIPSPTTLSVEPLRGDVEDDGKPS